MRRVSAAQGTHGNVRRALNPRWLTLHLINREFPLATSATDALFTRLGELQSTLLEIDAGTDESERGWPVTLRAIVLVGLARYRIDAKNADLLQLVDALTEKTRSPSTSKEPPEVTAAVLSLLALASDDSDVTLGVVKAVRELAHDAIQQHQPVRHSLLDEVAGLVTDRLLVLVAPATIDWIVTQEPIVPRRGVLFSMPEAHVVTSESDNDRPGMAVPDRVTWEVIRTWLTSPRAPERSESKVLSSLVPMFQRPSAATPEVEELTVIDVRTLVEPDIREDTIKSDDPQGAARESDGFPEPLSLNEEDDGETPSPEARAQTVAARHREYDAYDLLDEGVSLLASTCAAPTPDDTSWPGGWRGVDALSEDVQRLAKIGLAQYKAGLYPPSDRVEQAIERIGVQVVRAERSDDADDLPDVTGWRVGEAMLERTTAHSATSALRELGIESWRAGFGRRSLLTIRRLLSLIITAVQKGDTKLFEDLEEDLHLAVIRTAKWTDDSLADRERSRQLVLGLAPDFMAVGRAAQACADDEMWRHIFSALETTAWSPAGSEIEAATDIYQYFLAGLSPIEEVVAGRLGDITSWDRRMTCAAHVLAPHVREHLFRQLDNEATASHPGIALLTVVTLWRDVQLRSDPQALEAFCAALDKHILDGGRRNFELPELFTATEGVTDRVPQFDGPRIHWRLFDVAAEARRWVTVRLQSGEGPPAVLPPVATPDADLRTLIATYGAERLVDERQYWGIDDGDHCFIYVQEADKSRRLLRDCELKARAQFTWGYGGTGPHDLAQALVADILGALSYCPSCFGAIGGGAGLVKCPSCEGSGLRRHDLWALHRACYHVTASLPKKPDPLLHDLEDVPVGAQWQLSRVKFLDGAFAMVDERVAEDEGESDDE